MTRTYPNKGVYAKRVIPGGCDNVITAGPRVSCVRRHGVDAVLLEAIIVAYPVKANVTTVEGISDVCEILL